MQTYFFAASFSLFISPRPTEREATTTSCLPIISNASSSSQLFCKNFIFSTSAFSAFCLQNLSISPNASSAVRLLACLAIGTLSRPGPQPTSSTLSSDVIGRASAKICALRFSSSAMPLYIWATLSQSTALPPAPSRVIGANLSSLIACQFSSPCIFSPKNKFLNLKPKQNLTSNLKVKFKRRLDANRRRI